MARIDASDLAFQSAALDASIGRETAFLVRPSRPFSCLKTMSAFSFKLREIYMIRSTMR